MLLSPGVTQDPRSLTSAANGDLSFGGLRGFQNSFLVDGGDFNNAFFAQARGLYRAPYQFSNEVVQESASPRILTVPNSDAPAAPSSTLSLNPAPIIGTAPASITFATAVSEPPIPL